MKKQKGFAPILILIIIGFLIVAVAFFAPKFLNKSSSQISQSTATTIPFENPTPNSAPTSTPGSCQIAWINPKLPQKGVVEPLFLKDISKPNGSGYEGIVRRQLGDNNDIEVDLVTNFLPDANVPYYLWAVAVDSNNNVCTGTNLGQLQKIQGVGNWGAGPFTLPIEHVNDDQYFVITNKGFGANQTDQINKLSDPSIILEGAYKDAQP